MIKNNTQKKKAKINIKKIDKIFNKIKYLLKIKFV